MAIAGLVTLIVAFVLMELAFQRFDSVWGEVAGLVLFLVWLASIVVTMVTAPSMSGLRLPAGRVEIQIRTILQSLWANMYEKLADEVDRGIRYGEPVEPSPGVDVERIERAVQGMQEFSAKVSTAEADWQQRSEIEDPGRRGVALGAASMDTAMWVSSVVYAARKASGEVESSTGEDG
jgi:hypothetical protein